MGKRYLINDEIEFWPDENRLLNHQVQTISHILTGPAARCFLLLIENSPDAVNQAEFFRYVWEDEGMFVPQNTLYQNISLVRRGLRSVSPGGEDIITTIPRKGFQIKADVPIYEILPTPFPVHAQNEGSIELDSTVSPVEIPTESTISISKSFGTRKWLAVVLLLTSLSSVLIFIFRTPPTINQNFFSLYHPAGEQNGCHFFLNTDAMTLQESLPLFSIKLDCKAYPWVYIAAYRYIPTRSLIGCNRPISGGGDPLCVSVLMRRPDGK